MSDLFPGVVLPKPDYDALEDALRDSIARMGLQDPEWFMMKIIQVRTYSRSVCVCVFSYQQKTSQICIFLLDHRSMR